MILLRILKESFLFAIHALITNKLRTVLSLLGVTIGIFAIIAVLSAVDSLESNVKTQLSELGDDVVYIQKWPWGGDGNTPWWKYMNRPNPTLREFNKLERNFNSADAIAITFVTNASTIKYKNNSVSDVQILSTSDRFEDFGGFEIEKGRFLSFNEFNSGSPVAVLGADVAKGLFEKLNPIGKSIKLFGRKVKVIGVLEKQGSSMIGSSKDQNIILPINFIGKLYNLNEGNLGSYITVKPLSSVGVEQLKDELTGSMRSLRRLRPKQEDNFALNEISMLSSSLEQFFKVLNAAGILIGGFSILVGGFGIANIMFVSVKERTNIIGIQKSLGAKNYFILSQFLVESVVLSLLGGIFGLGMVFILMEFISNVADVNIFLGFRNILMGVGISVTIGLLAGIIPAWLGAKMNPVDAIRTGI
jgi:putative ABC transport system permease protein